MAVNGALATQADASAMFDSAIFEDAFLAVSITITAVWTAQLGAWVGQLASWLTKVLPTIF